MAKLVVEEFDGLEFVSFLSFFSKDSKNDCSRLLFARTSHIIFLSTEHQRTSLLRLP